MSDLNVSTPYTFYGPLKNIPVTSILSLPSSAMEKGTSNSLGRNDRRGTSGGDERRFVINNFMKQRLECAKRSSATAATSSDYSNNRYLMNGGDPIDGNESTLEGHRSGSAVVLKPGDVIAMKERSGIRAIGTVDTAMNLPDSRDDESGDKSFQPVIKDVSTQQGMLPKNMSAEKNPMYLMSFILSGGKQVLGNEKQFKVMTKRRRFSGSSKSSASTASKSAKFPRKLWDIVNSCESGAISWSLDGTSILVNYKQFQEEYLSTNSFKTDNIASFIRQLNLYGFRKVSPAKSSTSSASLISSIFAQIKANKSNESDENSNSYINARGTPTSSSPFSSDEEIHEFKNEHFMRGREELLVSINRTVNSTKTAAKMNVDERNSKETEAPRGLTKKGKPRMKAKKSQVKSVLSKTLRNSTTAELQFAVQLINEMLNQDSSSIVNGLSQELLEDGERNDDVIIENDLLIEASPTQEDVGFALNSTLHDGPRVITTFNTTNYSVTFHDNDDESRDESCSMEHNFDEDSTSHVNLNM